MAENANELHNEELEYFFTYGTLMRGRVREDCWPVPPQTVYEARVAGTYLFDWDIGYPAMVVLDHLPASASASESLPKEGRTTQGEVWVYSKDDAEEVRHKLDMIEGYKSDKERQSLYLRRSGPVSIRTQDGAWQTAIASYYVYNRTGFLLGEGAHYECPFSSPDTYALWSKRSPDHC
mmetsp:Transcript_22890/g.64325  ORF Transcript_22890/g.64325 Transcript_22890/m.64325 type:complete len:178 (+) Transcript_22890:83-616(+)|eukprot:CAMPEP_0119147920 /NCGR_PEP_ID=MMETSP1310-20130426/41084_1 /TAXON_ID=464262 /ORGANISM="Genus nov. species nov., Strain RCC2339" /LENGTH=177 /DNA_ID=CAMNT_0007139915 /DNA_START=1 /DNA_END=534 /DNA_ORIENTATION=+